MMIAKTCFRTLVWLLVLLMAVPSGIFAQSDGVSPVFRQEQLDQMLAPIALYPDSLLIQVLMAATYPIEVVAANRWANANRNLSGDRFAVALDQQNWDPSVKSLVNFPSVLGMMDQRLDWTQRLGDAFLSQEDQVMATVQRLRAAAQAQGMLQNTNQQRVLIQGQTIVIEPANPQVVYVPAYDPMVVYGPWWYPAYPPYRYYPAGAVVTGSIVSFGLAVAVGAAWGYAWGGFDWGHRRATVNIYQNTYVNNHYISRNVYVSRYGGNGRSAWQHDPVHRKGVVYRDQSIAQRFGQTPKGNPNTRRDFRGFTPDTTGMSTQTRKQGSLQERRDTPVVNPPPAHSGKGSGTRQAAPQQQRIQAPPQQQQRTPPALSGVGSSKREVKMQSDRGSASRQTVITPKTGRAVQNRNIGRPEGGRGNRADRAGSANAGRSGGGHPR